MNIKRMSARVVRDSRGEKTIEVSVNGFSTIAPSGKSKGKFEVKSYVGRVEHDVKVINGLEVARLEINSFDDLVRVEKYVDKKIGGNSLFALEASLLKALASSLGKELWQLFGRRRFPRPVGNAVGGGLHSRRVRDKKPEFQEFLFIAKSGSFADRIRLNDRAYDMVGKMIGGKSKNDEGAWETSLNNEVVLELMSEVRNFIGKKKIDIGLDIAANSFYKNGKYVYRDKKLTRKSQIDYVNGLIRKYKILYVEDPLNENDFSGFGLIDGMVVGDDLTVTNPLRVLKSIKKRSIEAVIVKPNQIGSLLKVKKVIEICRANGIKIVLSHRSGESIDDTIADLAVGFGADYIKTGIYGKVRRAKLDRVIEIENK